MVQDTEYEFHLNPKDGEDFVRIVTQSINGFFEYFIFESEDTISTFNIKIYSQKNPELILFQNEQVKAPLFAGLRYQSIDAVGRHFTTGVEKIALNEPLEIIIKGPPDVICRFILKWS